MLRKLMKHNKVGLLGLGVLLSLPALLFLLVPRNVTAPDQDYNQLNLGRSRNIKPIEQVALTSNRTTTAPTIAPTFAKSSVTTVLPFTTASETNKVIRTPTPVATLTLHPEGGVTAQPKLFPVRLELPAGRINTPIVESYLDQNDAIYVPLWEAGHYIGSARPGEKGNMVIVGHVRRGLVFNHLIGAKLDDLISIYDEAGRRYDYKIAQIELIPVAGATKEQINQGLLYTAPTSDERISLITCYPETSYANRLVVIGVPVHPGN